MQSFTLMHIYIVNADISHYLLHLSELLTIIQLSRVNSYLYQLISFTPLYKELMCLNQKPKINLDECFLNGYICVLDKLKHRVNWLNAAKLAASTNQLSVFNWLIDRALPVDYNYRVLDIAAKAGHLQIFQWFVDHQLPLQYSHKAIDGAATNGHLAVIKWIYEHNPNLLYSQKAVDGAAQNNHLAVIEWFYQLSLDLSFEFKYSEKAVDEAAKNGYLNILDWFWNYGKFKHSKSAIGYACRYKRFAVLQWFTDRQLSLKRPSSNIIYQTPKRLKF